MLSFGKILIVVLVALAAYIAYRRFSGPGKTPVPASPPPPAAPGTAGGTAGGGAEDLIKCPTCGVYVAANAGRCGKHSCPQRP